MDSCERRYGQWPSRFDRKRWQWMMNNSHSVRLKKHREEEEAAATIHHHLDQAPTATAATVDSRKGVDTAPQFDVLGNVLSLVASITP